MYKKIHSFRSELSFSHSVQLTSKPRQNLLALHMLGVPGALESVTSLLYTTSSAYDDDYLTFNLLGLQILKRLAWDADNYGKIGNAPGLLARIVSFTYASWELLGNPYTSDPQVRVIVKRTLKVVNLLVYTSGETGKELRAQVAGTFSP